MKAENPQFGISQTGAYGGDIVYWLLVIGWIWFTGTIEFDMGVSFRIPMIIMGLFVLSVLDFRGAWSTQVARELGIAGTIAHTHLYLAELLYRYSSRGMVFFLLFTVLCWINPSHPWAWVGFGVSVLATCCCVPAALVERHIRTTTAAQASHD